MLDDLLNLVFRAADVRPTFSKSRCLAVRQSPAACRRCADVCPHEAVTVRGRGVEIDDVDCSGCGLCVQACPSQALEPRVRLEAGRAAKCSQVEGDAQTVHCLGRLRPTDLHRLLRGRRRLVLARGDCADCPIGTAAVREAIDEVAETARELLTLRGAAGEIVVEQRDRLDDVDTAETLDRRALLRGGWRGMQRGASDALAPLDPGGDEGEVPLEAARTWRALELSDLAADEPVPWPVPTVNDACILCPICTKVCPTDAFSRRFDDDGGGALVLEPSRCIGCDACVGACPVRAIEMRRRPSWGEVSGGARDVHVRGGREGEDEGGPVAR
jgi:Fe-S-cluster-containing hydrogenase component 2